jgi:hypothetical protein
LFQTPAYNACCGKSPPIAAVEFISPTYAQTFFVDFSSDPKAEIISSIGNARSCIKGIRLQIVARELAVLSSIETIWRAGRDSNP